MDLTILATVFLVGIFVGQWLTLKALIRLISPPGNDDKPV